MYRLLIRTFLFSVSVFASLVSAQEVPDPPADYKLDSGDHIRIQIFNEENLSREIVVNDRGVISYPFIGDIEVKNLTSSELEQIITDGLKGDYLIDPRVFVDILQYRSFYVNGEVQQPGGFPFQPGMTVRKAISIAGGLKERASERKIFVIRDDDIERTPARINLDAQVRPGDIITVEQSFF